MVVQEDLIRKMVAEAIGTFILVLAGTGAAMIGGNYPLAFGFALVGIVYALGHVSGAHVNPAVTVGLALIGRFPVPQVPYYLGAQFLGAILASLFLRLIHGNINGLGGTSVTEGYSVVDGFLLELVTTALFVFIIVAVATDKRVPAAAVGLAIGATLLMIEIVAGPITGGSVNPARSLGPALASWSFSDIWIYLTAPFIGGAIGAVGYEFIRGPEGWAEDRPGPETAPPGEQRPRPQQRRRPAAENESAAREPAARGPQQRRPPQRVPYDPDLPPATLYDDEPLPPPQRTSQQRPPQQRAPQPGAPGEQPRRQQQRRRPPQE
jgi:MIP family channel proteins